MKNFTLIALMAVLAFGCSEETLIDCGEGNINSDIQVRIVNMSDENFENILVKSAGEDVCMEDIEKGGQGAYYGFTEVYRYAYIEITAGGDQYILQPIDYVGETPLTEGNYSYEIELVNPGPNGSISLTFKED